MVSDALIVLLACLFVATVAGAAFILRPARRRQRNRKRHSHRPKIDLFAEKTADPTPAADA